MKMYSYTKKNKKAKRIVTGTLMVTLVAAVAGVSYMNRTVDEAEQPVSKTEVNVPVISLPKGEEKAIRPYKVEAVIAIDYYDGSDTDIANMTKFEGTYRANQGIDYTFNEEAFDVLAILSGEVSDVKEDPLFGYSVSIKSDDITITYQSLQDMKKVVGDSVKQGDALSLASTNVYNKDLGNHVHIVVEKNGVRMDPEDIYGKSLTELK